MGEIVIWSTEEVLIWWLGIFVALIVLVTLLYWIAIDSHLDDEIVNKKLYDFVERHFGRKFLEVFKKYI